MSGEPTSARLALSASSEFSPSPTASAPFAGAGLPAVPAQYRGVWTRRLLETPEQRDDRSIVHWLQTSLWHADLRIPEAARAATPIADAGQGLQQQVALASQQGFCGLTEVRRQGEGEVCTWHRLSDFQPPRPDVDAGWMVFETPERVIETGVHARYLEVWERLPGSTGRFIVLAGMESSGHDSGERLLVAGRYLMHVRPRRIQWLEPRQAGQTLAELVAAYPEIAGELLNFEISFGTLEDGHWTALHSTLPELEGQCLPCRLQRESASGVRATGCFSGTTWQVIEWSCEESGI